MSDVKIISQTHIVCPHCRKPASTIDHLKEDKVDGNFKWYCNQCGYQYEFATNCHGDVVPGSLKLTGHRTEKTLVLLRNGQVGLVVEGMRFVPGDGQEDDNEHDSYFYDEHTCPTNFMASVKAVFDLEKRDVDPRGIFHHVLSLPYDGRIEDGEGAFLATLMDKFGNANET